MAEKPRFLVDCMMGKLAKWLRLAGFDTAFIRDASDDLLVRTAILENRILLTKDNLLSKRRILRGRCFLVESEKPIDQMKEVLESLSLAVTQNELLTRCIVCNGLIIQTDKESIRDLVPEYVFQTQIKFGRCVSCSKIYWRGTHIDHIYSALDIN